MEQNKEHKINSIQATSLIAVALLFDVLSLVPFINILSNIIAWLIFFTWLYLLGVSFMDSRKIATILIALLAEFIPLVSTLPALTTSIVLVIIMHNNTTIKEIAKIVTDEDKKEPTQDITAILKKQMLRREKTGEEMANNNNPRKKSASEEATDQAATLESSKKNIPFEDTDKPSIRKVDNITPFSRRKLPDIDQPAPFGDEDEWQQAV